MTLVTCKICGKEFNKLPSKIKVTKNNYCSRECSFIGSKRYNDINILNDYAEIIIDSLKYGIKKVLIDKEDIKLVENYTWSARYSDSVKNFYICAYITGENDLRLHRLIMNCPTGMVVDHINHDTLDNRKQNLRVCKQEQNMHNKYIKNNNKIGHQNIRYWKNTKKYQLRITRNKKMLINEMIDNLEDAILKRDYILNLYNLF